MPAPMQISLEEIISMLLQRVEALSASDENSKTKQNIIYRALYKKGLITEDILQWIKGDVEGIKKSMAEYEQKLREFAREEAAKKPKIEVAGANVLNQLDAAANKGGKLII